MGAGGGIHWHASLRLCAVEIRDIDGQQYVRLAPVAYEFTTATGPYDRNWLMIRGSVRFASETWSFIHPSLLTDEAQTLTSWLRAAAGREAETLEPSAAEPTWSNIEPNLGMGVVRYDDDDLVLRVFLRLESTPPSARGTDYFLDLRVTPAMLEDAAATWAAELKDFPPR